MLMMSTAFALIALLSAVNNIYVAFPRMEYWNSIELPKLNQIQNADNLIYAQQEGLDLIIKNATVGSVSYTGSMKPTIYGGNTPILRPYKYYKVSTNEICADILEGQIVIYMTENGFSQIIHRVKDNSIGNGTAFIQGDNNENGEFVKCEKIKYIVLGILYT